MGRKKVHGEQVRGQLLERAGEIVSFEGEAGLSLRRLAGETGTSTTAVYSLFGSKAGLVHALHTEALTRFAQFMRTVEYTGDLLEDLARLSRAYRASAHADPHYYRVIFGGDYPDELDPDLQRLAAETFAPLVDVVRRCIDEGVFVAAKPVHVAHSLWAAVHGLVSLEIGGFGNSEVDDDGVFESGVRAQFRGWCRETEPRLSTVDGRSGVAGPAAG